VSYPPVGKPDAVETRPQPRSRPGALRWLVREKRAVAGGLAVVLVVASAVVYFAGSAAGPESATADNAAGHSVPSTGPEASAGPETSSEDARTAAATPSTEASRTVPRTGWIPIDQAAWRAQVEAYEALAITPVPPGVGNLPEFRADCQHSHSRPDDPIVAPGLPGASHMHSFFGNRAVDAHTTAEDLLRFTVTTCEPAQDHSSYWIPTLYDSRTGEPVEPTGFRVYYRSLMRDSTGQMPMPNGLRLIAGDPTKREPTPRGAHGQFYCAHYGPGDIDGVARSSNGNWPICDGSATLHFILQFPDCWDGKHLDSPNHKDHVVFGYADTCPPSHPVKIPALTFDIQYPARGTVEGYYLSSDPEGRSASSMHGDAFVMWDIATMNRMTKDCILQRRTCDNYGYLT
jgi:hypothetical protein